MVYYYSFVHCPGIPLYALFTNKISAVSFAIQKSACAILTDITLDPDERRVLLEQARADYNAYVMRRVVDAEFPNADPVRRDELVRLRLLAEQMQADALTGRSGSACEVVRMANVIARLERELREAARPARDSTPSLDEYLAANRGEAAA
jgi:hypothetical protein